MLYLKTGIRFAVATLLLFSACRDHRSVKPGRSAVDSTAGDAAVLPDPPVPAGCRELGRAGGDLDNDGTDELAIGYSTDSGMQRKLIIYRTGREGWQPWHASTGPLMPGGHEDPFKSIAIERGAIRIHHAGGSRQHWDYLHRYRLNGEQWELIGATIAAGEPCDTFTTLELDLLTGQADLERESGNCDETGTEVPGQGDANTSRFRISPLHVRMDGFRPGENRLSIPGQGNFYY